MKLTDDQKFTALLYRHEDQAKLLQFMTANDLKIFISYLTLQVILGGFLIDKPIQNIFMKIGLGLIDLALAIIVIAIINRSFKRRIEVVNTISNCNEALHFTAEGYYLPQKKLNCSTGLHHWKTLFYAGIIISVIGIQLIIFSTGL